MGQHGAVDDNRKTILILEDNDTRVELMSEALAAFPGRFTVQRYDNVSAMRAAAQQWLLSACLISLDYALDGSCVKNPGNGMDAVQMLTEHTPVCPVIVHTSLPETGGLMTQSLREHGWTAEQVRFGNQEAVQDWISTVERMIGLDRML